MISTKKDRETTSAQNLRGGNGTIKMTPLFAEKIPHMRLLNEVELEPGASIGTHLHTAEAEAFYVLEGVATILENDGQARTLLPGEAHLCPDGEQHSLVNNGDTALRVLAIIPTVAE